MRGVRVLRDPWTSTAAMPTVPPSDIADCRHRPAGHQAADAGVVSRHASAGPGQERAVQHRAGPATWDFDQCRLAGSAQADAGDDRARPAAISLARAGRGSRSTTPISAVSAPGRAPDVVGAATPPLSKRPKRPRIDGIIAVETPADRRPLYARLQVVRGFQTTETKRLCSRIKAGTTVVSDGGQWFQCIAWQPGLIHERHVTGSDRTAARHPAFRWANTVLANVKNSLLATHRAVAAKHLPRYLGAFAWRFNRRFVLKAIHERLAIAAAATPPMPYRLLKLAEARW